jgi:hypothetical protein
VRYLVKVCNNRVGSSTRRDRLSRADGVEYVKGGVGAITDWWLHEDLATPMQKVVAFGLE